MIVLRAVMKRLLPLLLMVLWAGPAFAQRATLDDTARFLAGIPVGGPLAPLTNDPAWVDHARNLDGAWVKKDYYQVRPIRAWMLANAPEYYAATNPVFYMFGGPDFLYANLFFPQAKTYILAGLEPVGQVLGASDRTAAYPATAPVSPGDLATTIYHALGIDPRTEVRDALGRPLPLAEGRRLHELF